MAGGSDFAARIDHLKQKVGEGHLVGRVQVDQVYAQAQHNSTWVTGPLAGHLIRRHPGGGGGLYLSAPLEDHRDRYLQTVADAVLSYNRTLPAAMADNMEDLSSEVARLAPDEFGDLRRSAHPTVTDAGAVVYDRPATVGRLSRDELRDKARGSRDDDLQPGRGRLAVRRRNAELPGGDPNSLARQVAADRRLHKRRMQADLIRRAAARSRR